MRMVRDSKLVGHSHELLILDAFFKRGDRTDSFFCFPSVELLGEDTLLSESSIRRALRTLRERDLIRVVIRHNQSSLYYIHLPPFQEAWDALPKKKKRKKGLPALVAPEHSDSTEGLEDFVDNTEVSATGVVAKVRSLWPDHGDWNDVTARHKTLTSLQDAVQQAGSEERAMALLQVISGDPGLLAQVGHKARRLGPYLKSCFPGWLEKFENEIGLQLDPYFDPLSKLEVFEPDQGDL